MFVDSILSKAHASLSDPGVQVEERTGWDVGPLRADPTHEIFYSIDLTGRRIIAQDPANGTVLADANFTDGNAGTINLDGGHFEFSLDGTKIYYSVPSHNKIFAFESVTLEPVSQIDTPFPVSNFVIMRDGNFYVRNIERYPDQFAVIDPSTGLEAKTPSISLSYYDAENAILRRNRDGSRFFFKQAGSGNIYELVLSRHLVDQKTTLHYAGSGAFAFDESNNRIITMDTSRVEVHSLDDNTLTPLFLGRSHFGEDIKVDHAGSSFYCLTNGRNGKKYIRMFSMDQQIVEAEWAFRTVDGGLGGDELRYQSFDILPSGNLIYRCEKDDGEFYLGVIRTNQHNGTTAPTIGGLIASQGYHDDKIKLTWAPVSGAVSYVIYRSEPQFTNFESASRINSTTSTSYTDTNVDENSTYSYWVKSRSATGQLSDHSYPMRGYTKTAPPSSFPTSPSQGQYLDRITLRWFNDSYHYSHSVHIYRSSTDDFSSSTLVASVDGLQAKHLSGNDSYSTWTDTDIEPGERYYYWTVWENEGGTTDPRSAYHPGYSRETAPDEPLGLHASDGTFTGEVRLNWKASQGSRTYRILRSDSNDINSATIILAGIQGTRATDTTAQEGMSYYYWVVAENEFGTSTPYSSDVGHPETSKPITPISLTASKRAYDDKIVIEWEAAPNATSYDLYRADDDDPSSFILMVEGIPDNTFHDFSPLADIPYHYSVIARSASFTTGFSPTDFGMVAPPGPPPPANVSATKGDHMFRIDVSWDSVEGVSLYRIYRNTVDDFDSASFVSHTSALEYTYYNPPLDQEFFFWIISAGSPLDGDPSDPVTGFAEEKFLPQTTGVVASQGTNRDEIAISWNPVEGATGYAVTRNTVNEHENATELVSHRSGTSFNDVSAKHDITYYYFIRAKTSRQRGVISEAAVGYLAPLTPDPVDNVTATAGTHSRFIRLAWSSAQYAQEYLIQRSTSADGPFETIGVTANREYSDASGQSHVRYHYRIIAKNENGDSAASEVASGYRTHSAPTSIEASKGFFQDIVIIVWEHIVGADEYQILRGETTNSANATLIGTTTDSVFLDDTGEAGQRYVYFVRTITNGLTGPIETYSRGHSTIGPPFQPDVLIGKTSRRLKGNNLYSSSKKQKLKSILHRRNSINSHFAVESDGETSDLIVVYATKGNRHFRPIYRNGNSNVTSDIITQGLGAEFIGNERAYIKLTVRMSPAARRKNKQLRKNFTLHAYSYIDPAMRDRCRTLVMRKPK